MKKLFYVISSSLILSALTSIISYSIYNLGWLKILSMILIIVLLGLNVLYVFNYRNRKNGLSASLIALGVVLAFIGNCFIVKNLMLFSIFLSLSEISFIVAIIVNSKFLKSDLLYVIAIAFPTLLFVNLAPIFGYSGIGNRVLISSIMVTISATLGLSVSHLIRKRNSFNILFTIALVINIIYGFGLTILKQSNVTHRIIPIVSVVFYILMLIFSITILFVKDEEISKNYVRIGKRNIVYSVSIFLVTVLIGYTIVSNFLAFNFVSGKIFKNQFLSKVDGNLNIPIVEIYTQNNEEPNNKTDYVNCSFQISNCEEEIYNFSVPMAKDFKNDGSVGIRLRGNSTMKARKRPYRIKFDEKKSLFGLRANKSWVLLADYYDQSYIRNYSALSLAKRFDNLEFTPTPHHVALIINNEFKGLYLLCEQIDEKKGRVNVNDDFNVNVDTDFPFLVEMDIYACYEGVTGVDNFDVDSICPVEIKFPKADERQATSGNDKVFDYIYEYVNAVFKTILTNEKVNVSFRDAPVGLEDLVDIDSAVDYYLVNEIMMNIDSAYKSIYFYKTKDGKMKFGPVWDFDFSLTTELVAPYERSYIEGSEDLFIAENSMVFKHLIKNEMFYNKVVARYNEKKDAILETCAQMKEYKNTIDSVALLDAKMWHGMTGEFQFDMQYDYVRLFLMDRYKYLNTVFAKSHTEFLDLIKK